MSVRLRNAASTRLRPRAFAVAALVLALVLPVYWTASAVRSTEELAVTQPPAEKILIMGSSTTACAGDLDDPSTQCYVNLVRAAQPTYDYTVLGRGGTYVGYGTPTQNWTQTPIPEGNRYVVLQLGINDWYVPVMPTPYKTQLVELLGRVRAANPDADVLFVRTWMPNYHTIERISMWGQHEWVTGDAVESIGGTFVQLTGWPSPYRSTDVADHGWHYNVKGHKKIARAVLDWLAAHGAAPEVVP